MAFGSSGLVVGRLRALLELNTEQFEDQIDTVEKQLSKLSTSFSRIGSRMSIGITAPLLAMGRAALKSFGEFDNAMTETAAVLGGLERQTRSAMESVARSMSTRTVFSAQELAQAYVTLAKAGNDWRQSMDRLPVVAKLAQAGNTDLDKTVEMLTTSFSALGQSARMTGSEIGDFTRLANILLKAAILSEGEVTDFALALTRRVGGALRITNRDMEEGAAIMATFAKIGLRGSIAAERINIVLRDLHRAQIRNTDAWRHLGLTTEDAAGKTRPFADIIEDIDNRLRNLNPLQRRAALLQLGFQNRSVDATVAVLGLHNQMRRFHDQIKQSGEVIDQVSRDQMTAWQKAMEAIGHITDIFMQKLGSKLAPIVMKFADVVSRLTQIWDKLSTGVQDSIVRWGIFVAAVGPAVLALGQFLFFGKEVWQVLKMVGAALFVQEAATDASTAALVRNSAAVQVNAAANKSWRATTTEIIVAQTFWGQTVVPRTVANLQNLTAGLLTSDMATKKAVAGYIEGATATKVLETSFVGAATAAQVKSKSVLQSAVATALQAIKAGAAALATKGWAAATWFLVGSLKALKIALIGLAKLTLILVAVIVVFEILSHLIILVSDALGDFLSNWLGLKSAADQIEEEMKNATGSIEDQMKGMTAEIENAMKASQDFVAHSTETFLDLEQAIKEARREYELSKPGMNDYQREMMRISQRMEDFKDQINGMDLDPQARAGLMGMVSTIEDFQRKTAGNRLEEQVGAGFRELSRESRLTNTSLEETERIFQRHLDRIEDIQDAYGKLLDPNQAQNFNDHLNQILENQISQHLGLADAIEKTQREIDIALAPVGDQQKMKDMFRIQDLQAQIDALKDAGIETSMWEEQLKQLESQLKTLRQVEAFSELRRDADQLKEAIRTPQEIFDDNVKRYKEMLDQNLITQEEFGKAVKMEQEKLKKDVAIRQRDIFPDMAEMGSGEAFRRMQKFAEQFKKTKQIMKGGGEPTQILGARERMLEKRFGKPRGFDIMKGDGARLHGVETRFGKTRGIEAKIGGAREQMIARRFGGGLDPNKVRTDLRNIDTSRKGEGQKGLEKRLDEIIRQLIISNDTGTKIPESGFR